MGSKSQFGGGVEKGMTNGGETPPPGKNAYLLEHKKRRKQM